MDDKELIKCIQNGEKSYLNDIAEKYYDDIYYFCCYQTGNREDAYDLTQETFLRFIRYVENYRYKNLKGYLLTIAMNVCRNYFGRMKQRKMEALDAGYNEKNTEMYGEQCHDKRAGIPMGTDTDSTYQMAENKEQSQLLVDALMQLPDMQREAVLLHHFYGFKNREIAPMTGVSYGAVKSRVNQGIANLQQLLRKEDFYE